MSYLPELRRSLVRAAERRRRIAVPEGGQAAVLPTKRRRVNPRRVAIALPAAVSIVVALAVALLVLGHGRSVNPPATGPKPGIPSPGPAPSVLVISASDQKLIDLAQHKTAARDHACWPSAHDLPVRSLGSPSHELLSLLGVLRQPAGPAGAYARTVFATSPGRIREVYIRYARPVRSFHRARFFIVPAGDVTGFRAVPARCIAEQRATLERVLRDEGTANLARILRLQTQYLEWQRFRGAHAEGICVSADTPVVGGGGVGSVDCSHTIGEIEQGSAEYTLPELEYGVVPDGVAAVTMRFSPIHGRRYRPTTATVVDNVWVLVRPRGAYSPSAWIWRDGAGRVLRTIQSPGR
jgi:hypothetical protein